MVDRLACTSPRRLYSTDFQKRAHAKIMLSELRAEVDGTRLLKPGQDGIKAVILVGNLLRAFACSVVDMLCKGPDLAQRGV